MAYVTHRSDRLRSIGVLSRPGRIHLVSVLFVVMLAALITACGAQATTPKASPNAGRGGGSPFWNTQGTGGAATAIAWAESFQYGQPNFKYSSRYNGLCLWFVANAYGASYSTPYDTAWNLAVASKLNDPTSPALAPTGSLMFFRPNQYNQEEGHVGISLGNGAMISANEPSSGTGPYVVEIYPSPNIQSSAYWAGLYAGWAWPPTSWGPLATQAAASGTGSGATSPSVYLDEGLPIDNQYPYDINLSGFSANASIPVTCYDSARPKGFHSFTLQTDGSGMGNNSDQCYSGAGTDHWVIAGGVVSNHAYWTDGSDSSPSPTPTWLPTPTTTPIPPSPTPPAPTPTDVPQQTIQIGWSSAHPTWIWMTLNGFPPGEYTYTCNFGSGGDTSYVLTETVEPETYDNGHTCWDGIPGDTVWVTINSVTSNQISVP